MLLHVRTPSARRRGAPPRPAAAQSPRSAASRWSTSRGGRRSSGPAGPPAHTWVSRWSLRSPQATTSSRRSRHTVPRLGGVDQSHESSSSVSVDRLPDSGCSSSRCARSTYGSSVTSTRSNATSEPVPTSRWVSGSDAGPEVVVQPCSTGRVGHAQRPLLHGSRRRSPVRVQARETRARTRRGRGCRSGRVVERGCRGCCRQHVAVPHADGPGAGALATRRAASCFLLRPGAHCRLRLGWQTPEVLEGTQDRDVLAPPTSRVPPPSGSARAPREGRPVDGRPGSTSPHPRHILERSTLAGSTPSTNA